MFDPAADASLMCSTGVCLATVKSGEVSTGPNYSVSTLPHPAEGEAAVTYFIVLYKLLNKTLIKRSKEQKAVYKMQDKILLAGRLHTCISRTGNVSEYSRPDILVLHSLISPSTVITLFYTMTNK